MALYLETMMDQAAKRLDPTGTTDIRGRFLRDMTQRWRQLVRISQAAVVDQNVLGLGANTPQNIARSVDPVGDFRKWFEAAVNRVVLAGDGTWTQHYLDEASARAWGRAYRLVQPSAPTARRSQHHIVAASAASELKGVADVTVQRAVRAVSQALLVDKVRPTMVQRAISTVINKVGLVRSQAMLEMSLSQAFNGASLDAFASLGLSKVGIEAERLAKGTKVGRLRDGHAHDAGTGPGSRISRTEAPSASTIRRIRKAQAGIEALNVVEVLTAGDDDVCPVCEDISLSGPYTINEARGLIPAHPRCRCAFVPYFDDRFAEEG